MHACAPQDSGSCVSTNGARSPVFAQVPEAGAAAAETAATTLSMVGEFDIHKPQYLQNTSLYPVVPQKESVCSLADGLEVASKPVNDEHKSNTNRTNQNNKNRFSKQPRSVRFSSAVDRVPIPSVDNHHNDSKIASG